MRGRASSRSARCRRTGDAFARFRRLAAPHLAELDEGEAPDANDLYLLVQSLLGAWPQELLAEGGGTAAEAFRERMTEYARKALREAKRHTSWVNVNEPYEKATLGLIARLTEPGSAFLREFEPLARRLAYLGMLTGLARTVLKCTLPGVPDTYQGTEFWDLSLVDPDNRRTVDYAARAQALEAGGDLAGMLRQWRDGRIKQQLLARLLADRAAAPAFYAEADYQPLRASGAKVRHLLAFRRSLGDESLVIAVPRLMANLVEDEAPPLGSQIWDDTALPLPSGRWRNVLTGSEIASQEEGLALGELFSVLPIGVLRTAE
jgi:(1->4)-alpha-D-glucan 1-alpha-D-glucosylmutase